MRENTLILLKEAQKYHPSFNQADYILSSHLTMTMMAMEAMKASEEDIKRYFSDYIPRLCSIIETEEIITRDNFDRYLGKEQHFYAYLQFFRGELSQHGLDQSLPQWLSVLKQGLATAAFHPLIRLAYGIDLLAVDNSLAMEEIAISLAYLADSYQGLDVSPEGQKLSFHQGVDVMRENYKATAACHEAKMLNQKLECVCLDPNFKAVLKPMEVRLEDIEVFMRGLYLQASSIHTLHGITAAYAFGKLRAYLGNDSVVLTHFCAAIMALYCAVACPVINIPEAKQLNDPWPDILKKALQSGNEHTIKLVYVCHQYERAQSGRDYLSVAKRVLPVEEVTKSSFWHEKSMHTKFKPNNSVGGFPCRTPPM